MRIPISCFFICSTFLSGYCLNQEPAHEQSLNSIMSVQQQQKTGVHKLSKQERKELELWLQNYSLSMKSNQDQETLSQFKSYTATLNINVRGGEFLVLSDNTVWEVDPEDYNITSGWLSPVTLTIGLDLGNPYPFLLTNPLSNQSVHAKKSSWQAIPESIEPMGEEEEGPIEEPSLSETNQQKPSEKTPSTPQKKSTKPTPLEERQQSRPSENQTTTSS